MSEVEIFLKEFIESKNFKKLKSVNQILYSNAVFSHVQHNMSGASTDGLINYLIGSDIKKFTIGANVTIKDRRVEYILTQQYTVKVGEVISYYRDNKLQNILG